MMARPAVVLIAGAALAGLQACAVAGDPVPARALVPMAELRELLRTTPWECVNYDEVSRTCESISRTDWRDDRHGALRLTLLLKGTPRAMAVLSGPTWAEGDMECGRLGEVAVEVVPDAAMPKGAAEKIAAAMRRKLATREGRAVTCAGLVRDGEHFRASSRRDGRPFGRGNRLRLFAEPPALRVRDPRA